VENADGRILFPPPWLVPGHRTNGFSGRLTLAVENSVHLGTDEYSDIFVVPSI